MKVDLMRARMRARLATKAWNDFIENFEQVIMEGYATQAVKDEFRRCQARGRSLSKVMNKIMKDTKAYEKNDKFPV